MRSIISIIFLLIAFLGIANEKAALEKQSVKISGSLSINTNGIAPIPSFSFGKPIISTNLSISRNRFSYDPFFAYSFDLKPWIIDNWFHYKLVVKPKFEMRTGVNVSMFFSEYKMPEVDLWQGQRYTTLELAETYKFSETSSLSLLTWYDRGLEDGTISGYFINLVADKSDISIGSHFLMDINLQAFFIDYTDKNDGLFLAPTITCSSTDIPAFVFFQGIQQLVTNMLPAPDFSWNLGVGFSF
ncbi:MAG: hypothetical protein HQ522_18585 [Bacteroidetes bacterium]|nr:hypothetical protein [Bacteroidota bacterium]